VKRTQLENRCTLERYVRRGFRLSDQLRSQRLAASAHLQLRLRIRRVAGPGAPVLRVDAHVAHHLD
jgi:hypothetical protein